ncbi:MAG: DUF1648 domain-containing protein [Brachybacterium sp.]|nr:DUF1648 domain-containing protein [Brachybacterium sp.]
MSSPIAAPTRPTRTYVTGRVTKSLRALALVVSLAITTWILLRYPSLPDVLATHFGADGQADDRGPKWSILILAAVMLLLSLGLAALSTRPRVFNYPLEITEGNAQAVYREGERVVVWMALGVQVVYLGIAWSVLQTGGGAVLVLAPLVLLVAAIIGIIRQVRAAR